VVGCKNKNKEYCERGRKSLFPLTSKGESIEKGGDLKKRDIHEVLK